MMKFAEIHQGDALQILATLPEDSVDCCITSPPYWGLRDYDNAQQIGLEPSPFEYVEKLATVFDEVRRVLKPSGTCWLVIGDSYAGSRKGDAGAKSEIQKTKTATFNNGGILIQGFTGGGIKYKDLCGIPWRLAFALQDRGWYLRQDIIWAKPNPMPESVKDRCTRSHEYIFLLTKSAHYSYDAAAIAERSANRRDVWNITLEPYPAAHFATFPTKLVELCILAGSPPNGVVLDPFAGCGTTGEVAVKLGRRTILVELNAEYVEMIRRNLGLFVTH